jgi:glucan phosphoethanolaminetransferase (alkaline phosphatase superfamily)
MRKLIHLFICHFLLVVPVFLFEELFRSQFEPWELKGGVYRDAPVMYLSFSLLLALLLSWGMPRILGKTNFVIFGIFSFLVFYSFMCSEVAFDYRINFGTTWLPGEVFRALVLTKWYFYITGGVGLIFFVSVLYLSPNRNHAKVNR